MPNESMKIITLSNFTRTGSIFAAVGLCLSSLSAKPVPDNLGYGLDKLVESNLALKAGGLAKGAGLYNGYATPEAASYASMAIANEDGRFMVDITLNGRVSVEQLQASLQKTYSSFEVTAVDPKYHGVGIIEGWISVDDAQLLGSAKGVQAVFLGLKPKLAGAAKSAIATESTDKGEKIAVKRDQPLAPPGVNLGMLGSKFDQGVTQHRVDKINTFYNSSATMNYDGSGITVGVLSDSFNTRGTGSSAASAMASFDLPGDGGNPQNTQPVVVLADSPGGTDEGRGMAEIVYKMAPKAKIGFATANFGEVNFGNNIRALSGKFPTVPNTQAGFVADVICDDVSYGGEPAFSDTGIVMNAVDDVAAAGVSYFSSAANSYGVSVYNSDLRWVPNGSGFTASTNAALVGTNIDLSTVPAELYQGGFHNFNPNGQDVACLWTVANGGIGTEMQWDDPYDTVVNRSNTPIFTGSGTVGATPIDFPGFVFNATPQEYVIEETALAGQPTDGVVSLIRQSDNKVILRQDTGTDEVVTFFPPTADTYTIRVERFDANSGGSFDLKVYNGNSSPKITTDINMLAFTPAGVYVPASSLTSNNYANNRPVELGAAFGSGGQLQFVIARSSASIGSRSPARVRLGTDSNSNPNNAPAEYFDYNSAVTIGHSIAAGCNGVGAYDVFRPNVPQNFTSGGPALIFFDRNNNLKPNAPEVRLQPRLSAANNANTTWITGDSANDVDTGGGQFGGTSAASPHAAAIAALVLQSKNGPGSVTPAQMTSILQRSCFPHDLDPYVARGVALTSDGLSKVTVTVNSDQTATAARGRNDPNSHSIAYIGPSFISSFSFNPNGLASEGGGVTSGRNGVDASNNYFSNVTPGLYFSTVTATGAFAFTQGASTGLVPSDVVTPVTLTNPAPLPASQTVGVQGQTLTLNFNTGAFGGGDVFRFTIGRGLTRGPNVTNANGASAANYNADNFGGGVLIPEGTVLPDGMRFSGVLQSGATFSGTMRNYIGFGFSQLDGFGFINAEQAVQTPVQ